MVRCEARVAAALKLRENARACGVWLAASEAGWAQVTAMVERIRSSSGPAAEKRAAEKKYRVRKDFQTGECAGGF